MLLIASSLRVAAQVPTSHPAWLPDDAEYTKPFFPGANYDAGIQTPRQVLGFDIGDRPALHGDVERCFKAWSASPRAKLLPIGQTHERRTQYAFIVTSEANQKRLDEIRSTIARLADPRKLASDAEASTLIRNTPAVAWLAYCIHGDELSGTDGALAIAYHLTASKDPDVQRLLENLVVIIDPIQNPDGRDRFIRICDEVAGYTPNLDSDAIQHAGRWPRGRTNHYYFDMNRDWIYGVQPETRNRQAAITSWNPQILIDGHEMGPDTTFLFNPARDPFNPGLSPLIRKWWNVFANDAGQAFDKHGWSYYTREWADFWYPGYSDGWATMLGSIGILYEQARTGGRSILLNTGRILTYREAVHHQAVVSWANLNTLLANREAVLSDFVAQRRASLAVDNGWPQTFLIPPQSNMTRVHALLDRLAQQGLEIGVAKSAFTAAEVVNTFRETAEKREFPPGTIVVQRRQPLAPLVEAALGFDPRMDKEFLDSERRELEIKKQSRLYDITGWSPVLANGIEAYWVKGVTAPPTDAYARPAPTPPAAFSDQAPYAYVFDGSDDSVLPVAAHLMQAGVVVRVAEEQFRAAGRSFPRGSLLVRRHDNTQADLPQRIRRAAGAGAAPVFTASTARSPDDTPDLGGEHMLLLQRPKIALAGDSDSDMQVYGAIWHFLDHDLGLQVSLQSGGLGGCDLRRFNVIILPGNVDALASRIDDLQAWVKNGGTLIAIGDAAEKLADEKLKFSEVRRRKDVLKSLDEYLSAAAVERAAGATPVDIDTLWTEGAEQIPAGVAADKPETKLTDEAIEEWRKLFSPTGVIVRGTVSQEHWLTFGVGAELPLFAGGSSVLYSKSPVTTPVRFAGSKQLRLSGLLWPEAATRISMSAYATVERSGSGQLILFAQDPIFRGAWKGTGRLLANAILFGPGCGASAPAPATH